MSEAKYYLERYGPYCISAIIIWLMHRYGIEFTKSVNLNSALDSTNTIAALIIGFLGAILPVILGMKNESKFVNYVFQKDENKLFLKYIKSTIVVGLLLVFDTLIMYFLNEIKEEMYQMVLFYTWFYLIILFLLCTYRSLSNMLTLIFSEDSLFVSQRYKTVGSNKSEEEKEFERKNEM